MMDIPHLRQGLALVGPRGTGKTTIGRILAERLGRPFLDADIELERMVGRSIAAIFAEEGEPSFRDWEERILAELTRRGPSVLATGGGVVLRPSNRQRLWAFGLVIWLRAEPEVLATRLLSDPRGLAGRPALTAAGTLAEIAAVAEARAPLYREVADLVIDTGGQTPSEVADAILDAWPGYRTAR
jgi:shikimate kinase